MRTGAQDRSELREQAHDARSAVRVGLYVSALRCVLTSVVAPAAGTLGLVLGPFGLLVQILGAITSTSGALRLWRLGHRAAVPCTVVAIAVDLTTLLTIAATGRALFV